MRFKNFPYCVEPLPGEAPSSTIIRTAYAAGIASSSFIKKIVGLTHYNPNSLNLRLDFYKDPENVYANTLNPYYFIGLTKTQQMYGINQRLFAGGQRKYRIFSGENIPFKKKDNYYCHKCFIEDTKTYGTGYFHIFHQLDGIYTCHKHGIRLQPYKTNVYEPMEPEYISIEKKASNFELNLARTAVTLFGTSLDVLMPEYQKKFLELDLLNNQNKNDHKRLLDLFESRLPPEYFRRYLLNDSSDEPPWFNDIPVYPGSAGKLFAFYHVLLCYVLDIRIENASPIMPKPLLCSFCESTKIEEKGRGHSFRSVFVCSDCSREFSEEDFPMIDSLKGKMNLVSGTAQNSPKKDSEVLESIKPVIKEQIKNRGFVNNNEISRILGYRIEKNRFPITCSYIQKFSDSKYDKREKTFLKDILEFKGETDIKEVFCSHYSSRSYRKNRNKLLRLHDSFIEELKNEKSEKQDSSIL